MPNATFCFPFPFASQHFTHQETGALDCIVMTTGLSASQRALAIPRILRNVMEYVRIDSTVDLCRCCSVRRAWWKEAAPLLWAQAVYPQLDRRFACVAPERRQIYANFVQEIGQFYLSRAHDIEKMEAILGGLVFPRVHTMRLLINDDMHHLPSFTAPSLRILNLDPYFSRDNLGFDMDVYGPSATDWEIIFEWIPERFPTIEIVRFLDQARIPKGAVGRFFARLPNLDWKACWRSFRRSMVEEV
ncbi:hypothetical protein B0I35DRAFT_64451 [Stachybotrys elegans]|uniref:Uncharacterized protein n=1 Tax=Stachybotrys elegans TaxID=80388 RepID=A0A8K0SIW8_9HYPO|nr:hypothetical protein B0I35DRAFT_64451 [Stachybotrys elegans]